MLLLRSTAIKPSHCLSSPARCRQAFTRCARRPTSLLKASRSDYTSPAAVLQLPPNSPEFRAAVNPLSLAFLGDAIWSLYVRAAAFPPPKRLQLYHAAARPLVTAEAQARAHDALLAAPGLLTEAEQQLLVWAREASRASLQRRSSGCEARGGEEAYQKATALEALVGYLHLADPPRLQLLIAAALELTKNS